MNTLFCLSFAAGLVGAAPVSADWQSDYGKALAATRASGRPLLITLDKPSDPQHRISPARFSGDATQNVLLARYQLCHVDVTTEYGARVAEAFRASEFPFTAIIDRSGRRIIYRKVGDFSNQDWVATLVDYQSGTRPAPEPAAAVCFS